MADLVANDFPFVEHLPKREKSRFRKLLDHLDEIKRITDQHGILVPIAVASELAGVSRQRIDGLCEQGLLTRVDFAGRPHVTEKSLVSWLQTERKAGALTKADTMTFAEMRKAASLFCEK